MSRTSGRRILPLVVLMTGFLVNYNFTFKHWVSSEERFIYRLLTAWFKQEECQTSIYIQCLPSTGSEAASRAIIASPGWDIVSSRTHLGDQTLIPARSASSLHLILFMVSDVFIFARGTGFVLYRPFPVQINHQGKCLLFLPDSYLNIKLLL